MDFFTSTISMLPRRKKSKKKSKHITNFVDLGEFSGFASGVSGNGNVGGGDGGAAVAAPAPIVASVTDDFSDNPSIMDSVSDDTNDKIYEYSCAMLPISSEIAAIMQYWTKQKIPVDALHIDPDRGMDGYESNPHVTIKYGLHTDDVNDVDKITSGYGAVPIKFGNVSIFENPEFDVIKIDIISDELHKLNKLISDNLEHTDAYPTYKPHATLAFVKKGMGADIVGDDFFSEMKDIINSIYFTSREGSEYFIDI